MQNEEDTRTLEQNRKFHAMCGDLAKQKIEYSGQTFDREQWKRLFLGAAHGQLVVPNPFIDGDLTVVNKRSSSELPVSDMADLITQIEVFGIERGVTWRDDDRP